MSERQNISSGSPYEPTIGFSRAVRTGDRVLVAGTGPVFPDGSCPGDPALQMKRCIEIVAAALEEAGAALEHVVRTRTYLVNAADGERVGYVHGETFGEIRPAATMIVVAGFLYPRWKIELEAEAQL